MPTVTLLAHTPNPEKLVAGAAKLCYSSSDINDLLGGLTEEKTASFLRMLMELGHQSPLEHAYFTFGIEGVSRALLAQVTRHRIASFSVQSQRYVELGSDFEHILPPAIAQNEEARAIFERSIEQAGNAYDELVEILSQGKTGAAKKQALEDARFALPNACATKIILTMNARALRGFFAQRCCNRAQWEIRELAGVMLELCKQASPLLFEGAGPACISGTCPEGKMSCGRYQLG